MKIICYSSAGLLFLGALSMPSGYYDLLRWVVFIAAIYVAYSNYESNETSWVVAFSIIALVFNPLSPLYLYDKFLWSLIDISAGLTFIFNIRKFNYKKETG